jgi:large subunit ribosomal protein L49
MALSNLRSSLYMSFLRPLALPRASTLHRLLSTSSSAAETSTSTSASETSPQLTYRVSRTPSMQLPIYLLAKRGGNLKQTRLRKIEGNIVELKEDLQRALGIVEEKDIQINQLTRHIIIKVRSFMLPQGRLWKWKWAI